MSVEKAEDVLMHKRLLQMAQDPATRPAIEVRPAQVVKWSSCSQIILRFYCNSAMLLDFFP